MDNEEIGLYLDFEQEEIEVIDIAAIFDGFDAVSADEEANAIDASKEQQKRLEYLNNL